MTSVHELLTTLADLNVKLWVEEDRLRLSAPTGVLTPALQDQLRLQKHEILALFAQRNGTGQAAQIQPAARTGRIPLSFAQQRLWFLAQLEGPNATYNLPTAFRLEGKLQRAALQRALDQLVARHEILRTTFAVEETTPYQVIAPAQPVPLAFNDLSDQPAETQAASVQAWIDGDAQIHFDLTTGPLLHVRLLKLAEKTHVLSLTMHHIIADGWSAGILMQEFCTLYLSEQQGKTTTLPPLPLQYADYALWQQQQQATLAQQLAFWREQLTGAPPLLALPTDQPRPAQQRFIGDQLAVNLGEDLSRQLEQFAREQNVTLHMTLLAAFALLLTRYSSAHDLVIGTPVANRNRPEIELLIGFFVNTLALRFDLSGNPTFAELLQRVRAVTLAGYAHADAPLEQVVELLQPERALSHTPLFQTVFNFMTLPPTSFQLPGLQITALTSATQRAKFDLALSVGQSASGIAGAWEYNSELFARPTIERMARHWQQLLVAALATPHAPVQTLALFSAAELAELRSTCEGAQQALPEHPLIQRLFEAQVERTPDAPALIFEAQSLTYRQLNERANQLAHFLQTLGIEPGMHVGICLDRSLEMLVGILGILKAGGVYVPLDPALPAKRLELIAEDAAFPFVLTTVHHGQRLEASRLYCLYLDSDWSSEIAPMPPHNLAVDTCADAPIYLIYTSGSTGAPKGVIVPQRGVVNTVLAIAQETKLGLGDRFLQFVPFSFDASALEFFSTLCSGATLVLHPNPTQLSARELLHVCEEAQISVVNFTVALWQQWVDELAQQSLHFPSHLRLFLTGGEKPSVEHLQRWARLGDHAMTYLCSYGPTEASITSTIFTLTNQAVLAAPPTAIPLGRPLPNTSIYLLDEQQQLVPPGVTGEIYLGGMGVASGYLNRPELTKERFVTLELFGQTSEPHPNPPQGEGTVTGHATNRNHPESVPSPWGGLGWGGIPSPWGAGAPQGRGWGGRFYRTGDLARRRADGELEFVGRSDTQVKVRGFRIELGEIEAQIRQHPQVAEALVTAVDFGPQDKRLVAYFVAQADSASAVDLKTFLKARLPSHMVPAAFVAVQQWPLTANGKIDRQALPLPTFQSDETVYVAPRNAVETQLADIWAAVLGVNTISATSDFFALGGHSLLAAQVVTRIRQQFNVDLPLRVLFATPTLADLAQQIAQSQPASQRPPLHPVERTGELPLSFAQQRIWVLQQLNPESAFFNMPVALQLTGALDGNALQQSFTEIVRRHEVLRTVFPISNGRPVQRINPAEPLAIPLVDLGAVAPMNQARQVHQLAETEATTPFDLTNGPLLRIKLLRLTATDHVLLLTLHHIVGDDWSNTLLLREFSTLYTAFAQGESATLPPLAVQYADFAQWQRTWLQGDILAEQLAYWQDHLAGAPPLLQLPLDQPRPAQQRFVGGSLDRNLPEELAQKVRTLSRQQLVTPHMILFAALATLLARYSGMDDIVIGLPVANRPQVEVEALIGFFLNTLALRVKLHNNPSFLELLHQVKQVTTQGYAHQDAPFEQVVEVTGASHQLSHTPIFQVFFNYLQDHSAALALDGLAITPLAVENQTAKFDLTLTVTDNGNQLALNWEYNSDIFLPATIERMARHFEQLLLAGLADLSTPVLALPLLNRAERLQLLNGWNQTAATQADDMVMHQLFEQQAARTPNAIAAGCAGETLTYQQLNERANGWAHRLRTAGVTRDTVVTLLCPRDLALLTAILAVQKAGGAYLPVDPKTPAPRLQAILRQSKTPLLLTTHALQPVVEAVVEPLPLAEQPQVLLLEALQAAPNAGNLPVASDLDALAYVIFTSGSTGVPKGAMVEQRGMLNHLWAKIQDLNLTAQDVVAQNATQSFVIAVWQFLAALLVGGRVEIIPDAVVLAPISLLGVVAQQRVTILEIVPSLLRALLPEVARNPHTLTTLRWLVPTGEALPPALVRDWFALCPQLPLLNAYGMSECSDDVAHDVITDAAAAAVVNMPIGRPVRNVRLYVLDAQLQPTPIGVEGDLYVAGASVGRGYLNDPERTAAVFMADPFSNQPTDRFYKTGDRACWLPNGKIAYLGRRDFQVKVRGFRIELGEIESTLTQHPAVEQAVVIAQAEASGNQQLVAYAVAKAGVQVTPSTLRAYVAEQLPEYMTPTAVILLDQMPLNANGKLDRLALPKVTQLVNVAATEYVAPRNAVERDLTTILATVLNVDAAKLGVHHSFFDLGGHSLLAVQLLTELRERFAVDLPLRAIFEHTTIEALALLVLEAQLVTVEEATLLTLLAQVEQMTETEINEEGQQTC